MTRLTFVSFDGTRTEAEATPGQSLMQAAQSNDVTGIIAECGGSMACATCHVFLDEATFEAAGAIGEVEDDMLDFAAVERTALSRLSCQVEVTDEIDGAVITVPETQV